MSDITGPPAPKPVEPVQRSTGKNVTVSRDSYQSDTQAKNEKGDTSTKSDQAEQLRARDPAVSISASAAHLEIGEKLKEQIRKIDLEGRPIIVTETATFALKPDAGLRAGDDVKLEIIEAGSKVAADLLEMNGRKIDPPIRLSLIVIAIHAKEPPLPQQLDSKTQAPLPQTTGYGNLNIRSLQQESNSESLASIFSRTTAIPAPPNSGAASLPNITETKVADLQPRFQFAGKSNSEDLATLLAAQQEKGVTTGSSHAGPQNIQGQYRDIPASPSLDQMGASQNVKPGIEQPIIITAFSLTGRKEAVQLTETAPSANNAKVLSVQPLPPESVRQASELPDAFKNNHAPLAVIETTMGSFIAPLSEAQQLIDRSISVSPATETATSNNSAAPSKTYEAVLLAPRTTTPQKVYVSIAEQATNTPNSSIINAVHSLRTYPSPFGPMHDIKLETLQGDLLISMPEAELPKTGWTFQLHAASKPTNLNMPSVPLETTALSTLNTTHWPSLEQSFATLAGSDPHSASLLADRGTQGGTKLANSLLFFLSAAGRGDPSAWLGKDIEMALEKHNKPLLNLFKDELSKLMRAATDTSAEWRPVLLPMDMRSQDMPLIAMLLGQPYRPLDPDEHGGHGQQEYEGNQDSQRFILEVRFSVLGAIQLDGLIKGQQFDLAMRTEKSLSSALKSEATELFNSALGASGFSGHLNILETTAFPVDVQQVLGESLS